MLVLYSCTFKAFRHHSLFDAGNGMTTSTQQYS
jgi:hypothetical protein